MNRRGVKTEPEKNSGIPFESVPPGFTKKPESLQEMLARMVKGEISKRADEQDMDTFEESDDFEEEDPETMPLTHHEVIAMTDDELLDHVPYGVEIKVPQESPDEGGESVAAATPEKPDNSQQTVNPEVPQEQDADREEAQ